jgi:hypothetical protein
MEHLAVHVFDSHQHDYRMSDLGRIPNPLSRQLSCDGQDPIRLVSTVKPIEAGVSIHPGATALTRIGAVEGKRARQALDCA